MSFELQEAIYDALKADVNLMAVVSDVFDNMPQDYNDWPVITIGENIGTPFDSDSFTGNNNNFAVHIWDRDNGRKVVKEVQELVYQVLNRNLLTVSGYNTVDLTWTNDSTNLDPDGITYHGVSEYIAILERT